MKKKVLNILKKSIFLILVIPCMLIFTSCAADGANGQDGKSAYEIAVEHGFIGSEAEWLASLKGHDGTNGEDGNDAPVLNTYEMYLKAKTPEGGSYSGTYLDFLKTLTSNNLDITSDILSKCYYSVLTVNAFRSGSTTGTTGSAVIYKYNDDGSAYVVTNRHVTADGSRGNFATFRLYLPNSNYSIPATYIGGSYDNDVAVLKIEAADAIALKNANAEAVTFDNHNLGEDCYAIGDNLGQGMAITKGSVNTDSETVEMSIGGTNRTIRVFRHDSYINQGNSGGGLFNANGKLIGLTNGGSKSASSGDLKYYAIPASVVVAVTENVIENYEEGNFAGVKFNLGIETSSTSHTSYYDPSTSSAVLKENVVIKSISTNSIVGAYNNLADATNKIKVGDTIVSLTINGKKFNITRTYEIDELMLLARIGDKIVLELKNSSGTHTVELDEISVYKLEMR